MTETNHYKQTKEFFRISATERQGYYDAQAGGPLKHNPWQRRTRRMALRVLDKLSEKSPGNISTLIDVGCGRGDFTIQIAQQCPYLTKIYGCDFSKETLSIAQKDAASLEKITFQEANLLDMPFEDKQFDAAICINVLHHIHKDDLPRAVKQLSRITKKYLILEIKNDDNPYYHYFHPKSFRGITVYITSVKVLNKLFKEHGFRLKKQHGIFLFNWLSPLVLLVYEKL
jgi:ubiquinone/menaquinone biosynthesis C-methylase UbiE